MLDAKKVLSKILVALVSLITKTAKAPIAVETVSGSVVRTVGRSTSMTAPTKAGYTFIMWLNTIPSNWAGVIQPSQARAQTANFYVQYAASPSSSAGAITAYALYVRT